MSGVPPMSEPTWTDEQASEYASALANDIDGNESTSAWRTDRDFLRFVAKHFADLAIPASPGPTESDRRDTERRGIPEMTGCCKNCGERPEIHVGPVNDTTVISIAPRCRCTPFVVNPGFNLWPARVPSVGSSNATEEGA